MKHFLIFIIPIVLFSCNKDDINDLDEDELKQRMEAISESINNMIATSCENTDQCKAAAIGAKPCGGPTHYIIYSSGTDEEALNVLIGQYNEANRRHNELTGAISDCSITNPPTLVCVSGNCIGAIE